MCSGRVVEMDGTCEEMFWMWWGGGNGHIDERYVSMHAICVFVPVQWHWHWHLAIIASIGNKKDS